MAFRIGDHVLGGFLNNRKRHHVFGWLAFQEGRGLHIELIGDLAGRVVEFEVPGREPAGDEVIDELMTCLAHAQIGATGDMLLRIVRVPEGPIEELMARARMDELPPISEQPCLYLEWFSQNGRVVAEIVGVEVRDYVEPGETQQTLTPEPLPNPGDVGLGISGIAIDEHGDPLPWEPDAGNDDVDNPYGLFPPDLEAELGRGESDIEVDSAAPQESPQPRDWDDVIPGIDPETKAMYEQWDEIYGGTKDEMLSSLLDPPLRLPPPDEVTDETEARNYVLQIAASLARVSVAFDFCEHFDMVRAYRWLVEEILREGHVHPNQLPHGIVTHYSSWEFCDRCEAEFDAEYEQRRRTEEE
jgi:hypothetical protein